MKKFLSLALVIAMVFSTFTVTFAAAGTEEDPILISSVDELVAAANEINVDGAEGKYYKLTADIDFEGADWTTYIGTYAVPFKGVFDGDGHVIKNAKMPNIGGSVAIGYGIFGCVGGNGIVKNVGVENIETYKAFNGIAYSGSAFGGLVGRLTDNAKVDSCYAKGSIANTELDDASVWSGFYGDHISYAGGLVGVCEGAGVEVTNCYSVDFSEISDCASNNSGMIGYMNSGNFAKVENCYSNNNLTQVVAADKAKVINCYTTDVSTWAALGTRPGTLVTDAELKTKHTDLGEAFKEGPSYNNGYPVLTWQPEAEKMSGTGTEEDPYVIETKSHLIEASLITESAGVYFELAKDIDMNNAVWNSYIGSETYPFEGIFDGKGHVIRNVKFDVPGFENCGNGRIGIFGVVGGDAEIKNVGVETIFVGSAASWGYNAIVGGLVSKLVGNAKVDSCYVKDITLQTKAEGAASPHMGSAGAIAGYVDGEGVVITNCISLGFKEMYDCVSTEDGLVGQAANFAEISNCYSDTTLACVATGLEANVTNSYSLDKKTWAPANHARVGEKVTNSQLKALVETLGSAFKKGGLETKGLPALSWMTVSEITIAEGNGTYTEPYIVKTVDDLKAMVDFTETAGVYFELANDIDMGGALWDTYIGTETAPFAGVFNGNGHVIKNFKIDLKTQLVNGLFAYTGGNASIFNLGVKDISVTTPEWNWDRQFGGLVGFVGGNTALTECYAKNVEFNAGWEITTKETHGHINTAGGLFGWAEGDGVEIRYCYALGIDRGVKEIEGSEEVYHLIMYDGGLGGRAERIKAIDYCYSDTYVVHYPLTNNNVSNCYFQLNHGEWWPNTDWAGWQTDVKYLSNLWSVKFLPQSSEINSPTLKWEHGGYLNLVPAGSMNVENPAEIFGAGTSVSFKGRPSRVLSVPAASTVSVPVTLEEGKYYKVSFKGMGDGAEAPVTFTLGDIDLGADITDMTLAKNSWETKAAFVKADATQTVNLVIDSEAAIALDDIEVIEINTDYEAVAVRESIRLDYFKVDSLQADMYVDSIVADGVEVKYETENGYMNYKGELTNIPVGFGTVEDTFIASVDIADVRVEKTLDLVIEMIQPVVVKGVMMTDAEGNTVYDVDFADKVSYVEIVNNTDEENMSVMVALYKEGKLTAVKTVEVDETGSYPVGMDVNGADKVKLFALRNGSIEPLSFVQESYDTLDADDVVELHTIGDSIVTDYAEGQPLNGWGQRIDEYFDADHLIVDNRLSRGGMSAREFLVEPVRWATLVPKLDKNDYVFIQLSHNDASMYGHKAFKDMIAQFVDGVREKGAIVVFVTSPEVFTGATDTIGEDGKYVFNKQLKGYPEALKELAAEKSVPVIDLNEWTHELMAEYGKTELWSKDIWVSDNVHFSPNGAKTLAGFITNKIKELKLPIADFILEDELPAIEDLVK